MKTLSILFFALFLSVSCFARVRSVAPASVTVLQVRCVDSVEFEQVLVCFEGKERVCVIRRDCGCVVNYYIKPKNIKYA